MTTLCRLAALSLLCFPWSSASVAQTITVRVRLVYLKNGKPAKGQNVGIVLGNPTYASRPELYATTSAGGVAVFHIPEPPPSTVWVDEENGRIRGCAVGPPSPIEDVLKRGVTIGVDARFGEKCKGDRSAIKRLAAKPGEIVMFVRKLSIWEKMQN